MSSQARVLFFVPYGAFLVHNQIDAVLALSLRARGAEVLVVLCDGLFPLCEVYLWDSVPEESCRTCARKGEGLFHALNLPRVQLRTMLTDNDFREAYAWAESVPPEAYAQATYESIPIGEWATSSVYTYFHISEPDLRRPDVQKVHKQYLANTLITHRALARIIDEFRPTKMVGFNGRMYPYRAFLEAGHRIGVDVVIHERGLIDNSFIITKNHRTFDVGPMVECTRRWSDIPLTKDEILKVKRYFLDREEGKGMNIAGFYSYRTESEAVRSQLNIPPDAPIIGFFTSSEFELAFSDDYRSIVSQMELLDRLIDTFRGREEYLVIRHHPYIGGNERQPPGRAFLAEAHRQALNAPPNVRVIMPDEKFNSYALLWNISACISPFSTVALEAQARGVGSAIFAQSPYASGVAATIEKFDPDSILGLIERLREDTAAVPESSLGVLYRYIHAVITKWSREFRVLGIQDTYHPRICIQRTEDILPGHDPVLDCICDSILHDGTIDPLPGRSDYERGTIDEEAFFEREREEILSHRKEVAKGAVRSWQARRSIAVSLVPLPFSSSSALWWHERSIRKLGERGIRILDLNDLPDSGIVLFQGPNLLYDSSLVHRVFELLEQDPAIDAAVSGLWFVDPELNLEHEVLTRRQKGFQWSDLPGDVPLDEQLAAVAGALVGRKSFHLKIRGAVQRRDATALTGWIRAGEVVRLDAPYVMYVRG